MAGFARDNLSIIANLKRLVQNIDALKKQFAAAGDKDSVENLTAAQLDLADQIGNGESGKYLINQLVAIAAESIALQQLDKNTAYDFLGGETPAQIQQELKDQKLQLTQITKNFSLLYPQLTEEELLNYTERVKTDGEFNAMKWAVQQHQQNNQ